jgi:hypothetical protein
MNNCLVMVDTNTNEEVLLKDNVTDSEASLYLSLVSPKKGIKVEYRKNQFFMEVAILKRNYTNTDHKYEEGEGIE